MGFTSRVSILCGFTAPCLPEARRSGMASAIPSSRPKCYWLFLSFRPSPLARLLRPLLTSAMRSGHLTMPSVTSSVTHSRSPVISSTAFHARPPDLPPVPLMDMGFAIACLLARHRRPHHPVLVHRPACLLHASFRPHLAVTPLRFARPSPPSGWSEDFHLQAAEHARRTRCSPRRKPWVRKRENVQAPEGRKKTTATTPETHASSRTLARTWCE